MQAVQQQSAAESAVQEILVRAMPGNGRDLRWRAGRAWGKAPVRVRVGSNPTKVGKGIDARAVDGIEISHEDYQKLIDDPHIAVAPVGAEAPSIELKAQLLKAQADVEALRKEMDALASAQEQERAAVGRVAEETHTRIVQLEAEKDKIQSDLTAEIERLKAQIKRQK